MSKLCDNCECHAVASLSILTLDGSIHSGEFCGPCLLEDAERLNYQTAEACEEHHHG